MAEWTQVGECPMCKVPIFNDGIRTYPSCTCTADDPTKPPTDRLPAPPKHPDIIACERAGGHVIVPRVWPLPIPQGPLLNSALASYELVRCLKCRIVLTLEPGRHTPDNPPQGFTILTRRSDVPQAPPAKAPLKGAA